jgi:hypothetical protein
MEENVPGRTAAEYVDSGRAGFRSDRHISPLLREPCLKRRTVIYNYSMDTENPIRY